MKILVLGDIILDEYNFGEVSRVSPEAPIIVHKYKKKEIYLGGAANVANHLRYNYNNVSICGLLGVDNNSKIIKNLLKKNKIFSECVENNKYFNSIKKRFISQNQSILRHDKEPDYIKNDLVLNRIKKIVNNYNLFIISDYNKFSLTSNILKKIIKILRDKNKYIAIDTKKKDITSLKGINLLKCNLEEAKNIFDLDKKNYLNVKNIKIIQKKLQKYNIKEVVITLGDQGSALIKKKNHIFQNTNKRFFYDLSGAGDAFFSSYVFCNLNRINENKCLKISNDYSGRIIENFGNNPKKIIEVKNQNKIIKNLTDFKKIFMRLKKTNKKIIFANGCFDIYHYGHEKLISFAKNKGGYLFLLINSDKMIKKIKGKNRPVNNDYFRSNFLSLNKNIDYIFIFNDLTPEKIINKFTPDVLVKGSDYKKSEVIGYKKIEENGGKILLCPLKKNISTTKIIKSYK